MGDCQDRDRRGPFDRPLRLKFLGSKVTNDARLLAYRELDEAFRLAEMAEDVVEDSPVGKNKQYQLVPLLRQSVQRLMETMPTRRWQRPHRRIPATAAFAPPAQGTKTSGRTHRWDRGGRPSRTDGLVHGQEPSTDRYRRLRHCLVAR